MSRRVRDIGKFVDLTGQKFGRLTVIERAEDYVQKNGGRKIMWYCNCDCGNENIIVRGDNIKNGTTKSCGCLHKEISKQNAYNLGKANKKYNTYDLSGEYGIGYTSKGERFYFDLEDYDKIKDYCWYFNNEGYVISKNDERKKISFHRLVTNCPDNMMPDHIHGETSRHDNRKCNLRICTNQENCRNSKIAKNNTSGVTGVYWDNTYKKWKSQIKVNYKYISLGYFVDFKDAVKARKEAEEIYFGEFSYDNSMKEGEKFGDLSNIS